MHSLTDTRWKKWCFDEIIITSIIIEWEGDGMGRRKVGLPARATWTVLAAVLVAGLTPWNGVALADEFSGESSGGVAVQAADGATLYGSA